MKFVAEVALIEEGRKLKLVWRDAFETTEEVVRPKSAYAAEQILQILSQLPETFRHEPLVRKLLRTTPASPRPNRSSI